MKENAIERRLAKLWRAYYLKRIFLPIWPGKPKPSPKAIYTLDRKGAEVLQETKGIDPELLRARIKQNEVGERYLKHSLMISNFRAILSLVTNEEKNLELLFFRQDKGLENRIKIKNKTYPVIPDGFFGLEDQKGKFYFFLEADRSTMSNRRYLSKLKAYWYWKKEKGQTKKFNIKNFRVLTLTKSKERAESLRETALKLKEVEKANLMTFWFSDESKISLEDPQTIFNKIWKIANDDELHSLFGIEEDML